MAWLNRRKITIVGGGAAGLSLGIGLRKEGIPVRLIEAGEFPRHRVCAEMISGVSQSTLENLGLSEVLEGGVNLESSGWFDQHGRFLEGKLPAGSLGISRYRLDDSLAKHLVEEGGEVVEGERFRPSDEPSAGHVLATGRPSKPESAWIGLKAHFRDLELEHDMEVHFGLKGYLVLTRIEEGLVNACGLFRRRHDLKSASQEVIDAYVKECGLVTLAERLEAGGIDDDSCVSISGFKFEGHEAEPDGWMRVGDRSAILPPFTGDGLSMAFEAAEAAMEPVIRYSEGVRDWADVVDEFDLRKEILFRRREKTGRFFHSILRNRGGRLALSSLAKIRCLPLGLIRSITK